MSEGVFHAIFGAWDVTGLWFTNCILAILVTAIIMGTLYALATAFNLMGLKRYASSEFLQLAATAVMVILLVGLVDGGQAFFLRTAGGSITCHGEQINDTIEAQSCRTQERLEYFNGMFYEIKDGLNDPAGGSMESRYYFSVSIFGIMIYQGMWDADLHRFVETGHAIEYKIISLMISLNSQLFVLKYIGANMLAVFLPLGIILRVLHFTRGIGGFFIALAISLYFIYPGVLFMMDASNVPTPPAPPSPVMDREELCNIPVFSGFSLGSSSVPGQGTRSAAAISVSSSNLAAFISEVFVRLFYDNMVALAIALTAMRYGTTILGGESGMFLQMMGRWV